MRKKSNITEEESSTFRDIMRDVKPLTHTKIITTPTLPPAKLNRAKKASEPDVDCFSDYETLAPVGSEGILQFSRSGIQHKILRNLRNGKYNVEATLDLHGKTVEKARPLLGQFLSECRQHGMRHVLVIHGKGRGNNKPILKNKLNHWLRQTEQVLAFSSATTKDGHTGAVYVLLKVQ